MNGEISPERARAMIHSPQASWNLSQRRERIANAGKSNNHQLDPMSSEPPPAPRIGTQSVVAAAGDDLGDPELSSLEPNSPEKQRHGWSSPKRSPRRREGREGREEREEGQYGDDPRGYDSEISIGSNETTLRPKTKEKRKGSSSSSESPPRRVDGNWTGLAPGLSPVASSSC